VYGMRGCFFRIIFMQINLMTCMYVCMYVSHDKSELFNTVMTYIHNNRKFTYAIKKRLKNLCENRIKKLKINQQ